MPLPSISRCPLLFLKTVAMTIQAQADHFSQLSLLSTNGKKDYAQRW